jgi:serine/threonine-protein kinase
MRELISTRWSEVEALLDTLLELPAEQRESELERHCDDEPLRVAVMQLLALDARDNVALDQVALALGGREPSANGGGMEGQHIGPYRIERALGEGGMGAVFLATRQTSEFTQHVALKLLRSGLFSTAQQEQFRREQKIHARLEHAHIARIYDSGISAAGVPYFAMEYIDGTPVTDYCDSHRLGIEARLKLFASICEAVAYAHQNLIVHRDLKPSNILVGDDGEPKLLDFGIAKLLPTDASEGQRTRTELRQLTPNYAAPEQFDGGTITTATDVYALGVLLCELLTGSRPPPASVDCAPLRASSHTPDPAAAAVRDLSPRALKRRLRGDLESIVGKALQSEPQRRYPGATALREDIVRHLDGNPIQARPDAATYRLGKFIQRHKVGFAASLALVATLISATVFSLQQARRARAAAALAEAASAKSDAEKRFLLNLFVGTNPGVATAVETPEQMLAYGRQRVARDFPDQPELQVEVLGTIGDVERQRGRYAESRSALEQAADIARTRLGAGDERTLNAELLLVRLQMAQGQYTDASRRLDSAVAAFREQHNDHHQHDDSEILSEAVEDQARLRIAAGDDAVALAGEALAIAQRLPPADGGDQISHAQQTFADALTRSGRAAEALAPLDEARAYITAKVGSQHAFVATILRLSASAQAELGRYDRAEELSRQAVAIYRQAYKRPYLNFASGLSERAAILAQLDRCDESITVGEEALAMQRKLFSGAHVAIAGTLAAIGGTRYRQHRYADAKQAQAEALDTAVKSVVADHPIVARIKRDLGRTLAALGRHDEAQSLLDAALVADRKRYGQSHSSIAADLIGVSELAAARNDPQAALDASEQALAMYAKTQPETHPTRLDAQLHAADYLLATRHDADALAQFSTALQAARAGTPPIPNIIVRALTGVARADLALASKAAAQQALREAQAELKNISGNSDTQQAEIAQLLAATR